MFTSSNHSWVADNIRRADLAATSRVRDAIASVLDDDALDDDLVTFLTARKNYAFATKELIGLCRTVDGVSIVPALLTGIPRRIAGVFRAIEIDQTALVTVEFLADIARSRKRRAKNARVAVAACVKPIAPWRVLSQRERAAYLLGLVVRCMRDGAVP